MNQPIFISLSPNVEADDVRTAWRVLLRPGSWQNKNSVTQAEHKLQQQLAGHSVCLTSSGRAALVAVLQAWKIGAGDEVVVQGFTCVAVPASVVAVGAKPIYVDIEAATYNIAPADLRRKITTQTRAIIVQHTFGIPADVAALRAIVGPAVKIIEDCAHGFGGTSKQRPVGTLADAAILSFGREKTISSVFGGAVATADLATMQQVRAGQAALPYPPTTWVLQQLLHPIVTSFIKPLYFRWGLGKILLVAAQKIGLLGLAVSPPEKKGGVGPHVHWQASPALAQLLLNQLAKLDRFTSRRRHVAARYQAELALTQPLASTGANWLRLPVTVSAPSQVLARARAQQMVLGDWYNQPIMPVTTPDVIYYQPGSCPVAEQAATQTINLPTHPTLSAAQVTQVITFIKPYLLRHAD